MRRLVLAILALFALSAAVLAQAPTKSTSKKPAKTYPKYQLFAGYSYVHASNSGFTTAQLDSVVGTPKGALTLSPTLNGGNFEGQYNWNRWLGFAADVEVRFGTPFNPGANTGIINVPTDSALTGMIGPVITRRRSRSKWTPFAHALIGIDRLTYSASIPSGLTNILHGTPRVTDTNPAAALGGGVDYKYGPRLSFRVAQADYFYTAHDMNIVYGDIFGTGSFRNLSKYQSNIRISTGFVFNF